MITVLEPDRRAIAQGHYGLSRMLLRHSNPLGSSKLKTCLRFKDKSCLEFLTVSLKKGPQIVLFAKALIHIHIY